LTRTEPSRLSRSVLAFSAYPWRFPAASSGCVGPFRCQVSLPVGAAQLRPTPALRQDLVVGLGSVIYNQSGSAKSSSASRHSLRHPRRLLRSAHTSRGQVDSQPGVFNRGTVVQPGVFHQSSSAFPPLRRPLVPRRSRRRWRCPLPLTAPPPLAACSAPPPAATWFNTTGRHLHAELFTLAYSTTSRPVSTTSSPEHREDHPLCSKV
jgi:hypothetical protein